MPRFGFLLRAGRTSLTTRRRCPGTSLDSAAFQPLMSCAARHRTARQWTKGSPPCVLYADFGDLFLARAAYNWGEGAVHRAIAANKKCGKPTDYPSLKMPAETRSCVPKLQAVKNIVSDPERFDLLLAAIPDAPYFTVARTTGPST